MPGGARGATLGTVVVVDVNARWHLWKGRDARAIQMVLREADVVWSSAEDLFGLNLDVTSLRAALRPSAVLVLGDGQGNTRATGPFGEVQRAPKERGLLAALGERGRVRVGDLCGARAREQRGMA